jgi:hypothetical protein
LTVKVVVNPHITSHRDWSKIPTREVKVPVALDVAGPEQLKEEIPRSIVVGPWPLKITMD